MDRTSRIDLMQVKEMGQGWVDDLTSRSLWTEPKARLRVHLKDLLRRMFATAFNQGKRQHLLPDLPLTMRPRRRVARRPVPLSKR